MTINGWGGEFCEVAITPHSQKAGAALSTSEWQKQAHPRSGIIFIHSMDVNVCLWCSQCTTEIINQKQLQCTWQIAALPSLQGTCFIYTSSLAAYWLITFQVQYLKVSGWHKPHLGFPPSSSQTLKFRQEMSPCLSAHSYSSYTQLSYPHHLSLQSSHC